MPTSAPVGPGTQRVLGEGLAGGAWVRPGYI